MTTNILSRTHAAAFVALIAAGCATGGGGGMYSQPYALFEPERRSVTDDRAPAPIMSIDGASRSIADNSPVALGRHTVIVSVPGPRGMSDPGRTTLEVDAKACTRHYFAAKRSSRTASDWEGYVSGSEAIPECTRKFPEAK